MCPKEKGDEQGCKWWAYKVVAQHDVQPLN